MMFPGSFAPQDAPGRIPGGLEAARAYDALSRAIGDICGLFEPQEGWNDPKAAGYASG